MSKTLKFTVLVWVMVFIFSNSTFSQTVSNKNDTVDLASTPITKLSLKDDDIESLLVELSFDYDIPIGLELAIIGEPTVTDVETADFNEVPLTFENDESPITSDFKDGTLADVMNQIVSRHNYYQWEIKDGVVNVFPKEAYRNTILKQLLETEIKSFSLKKGLSCSSLGISLSKTKEIRKILEDNNLGYRTQDISGFYIMNVGKDFSFDVSDMPLKSILNKVVKESPLAKYWIIRREHYDEEYIRLSFVAKSEFSITLKKKKDADSK